MVSLLTRDCASEVSTVLLFKPLLQTITKDLELNFIPSFPIMFFSQISLPSSLGDLPYFVVSYVVPMMLYLPHSVYSFDSVEELANVSCDAT
jgi:hypothetical protein